VKVAPDVIVLPQIA